MILKHSIFGIAFVLLLLKRSERFLSFPETMKERALEGRALVKLVVPIIDWYRWLAFILAKISQT